MFVQQHLLNQLDGDAHGIFLFEHNPSIYFYSFPQGSFIPADPSRHLSCMSASVPVGQISASEYARVDAAFGEKARAVSKLKLPVYSSNCAKEDSLKTCAVLTLLFEGHRQFPISTQDMSSARTQTPSTQEMVLSRSTASTQDTKYHHETPVLYLNDADSELRLEHRDLVILMGRLRIEAARHVLKLEQKRQELSKGMMLHSIPSEIKQISVHAPLTFTVFELVTNPNGYIVIEKESNTNTGYSWQPIHSPGLKLVENKILSRSADGKMLEKWIWQRDGSRAMREAALYIMLVYAKQWNPFNRGGMIEVYKVAD